MRLLYPAMSAAHLWHEGPRTGPLRRNFQFHDHGSDVSVFHDLPINCLVLWTLGTRVP